ncbi:MAG TPA: PilZ domain-containing protein [Kofleriaceae bacterium]
MRFRTTVASAWVNAQTRDIGVGGAFIACQITPPVGTTLTLELTLPTTDQQFTIPAVVRWASADGGMGVQFVGVDVDVLLELNDYFATLTS